jgi:hypothetical protein
LRFDQFLFHYADGLRNIAQGHFGLTAGGGGFSFEAIGLFFASRFDLYVIHHHFLVIYGGIVSDGFGRKCHR